VWRSSEVRSGRYAARMTADHALPLPPRLETREVTLDRAVPAAEREALLARLASSPLFTPPSDPRLTRPRPAFELLTPEGGGPSVVRVTAVGVDLPNVVRLVRVVLRLQAQVARP